MIQIKKSTNLIKRNQAILLDGLSSGEIISVTAVNAKAGLEGRTELFLTPFSTIIKKN